MGGHLRFHRISTVSNPTSLIWAAWEVDRSRPRARRFRSASTSNGTRCGSGTVVTFCPGDVHMPSPARRLSCCAASGRFRHVILHDSSALGCRSAVRGMEVPMRLLKWLGVQLWKHPLRSSIVAFAAGFTALSLAPAALPRHTKAIEHIGGSVVAGLVWLVILILIIKAARWMSPKEMNTATVMVAVFGWIVYIAGFQIFLAALASSGDLADSLSWAKGEITGGIGGQVVVSLAGTCLLVIPGLLVIYPQELRRRLPWGHATELSRTLLPAWLAAAAAVITWIYILLSHLAGGPLASTSVPVLLVAGVGVATLLLPLYQFMARSCWQYRERGRI